MAAARVLFDQLLALIVKRFAVLGCGGERMAIPRCSDSSSGNIWSQSLGTTKTEQPESIVMPLRMRKNVWRADQSWVLLARRALEMIAESQDVQRSVATFNLHTLQPNLRVLAGLVSLDVVHLESANCLLQPLGLSA